MNRFKTVFYTIFLFTGLVFTVNGQMSSVALEEMAKTVCADVGTVESISKGSKDAPIIIFEENHASRQIQLQIAVSLVRLYQNYGVRDFCLEGYLADSPTY